MISTLLRQVIDPDLGINIVDLGLVESIEQAPDGSVRVLLLMTSPACPQGDYLCDESLRVLRASGLTRVEVSLRRDLPWDPSRLSPEARRLLGWDS